MALDEEFVPASNKKSAATKKPRAPRGAKKKAEEFVMDPELKSNSVFPTVPVYTNSRTQREIIIPREVQQITRLGSEASAEISALSSQLLNRVKVADSGDVGKNMTELLALTQRFDFDKIGSANDKGIVARLRNIFGDTKVKVLAEFQTISDQMGMMVEQVQGGVDRMAGETTWLTENIRANNNYIEDLEELSKALSQAYTYELEVLETMKADPNVRANDLFEQSNIVDALDKQYNKILRQTHLANLTDPQLKSMLVVNQSTIEKFEDIKTTLLPTIESRLSMELVSLQQGKDNELAAAYDREANRIVVDTSKSVADNMKNAAKASGRSIIELESLKQVQSNIVGALQEVIKINADHRAERQNAVKEIAKMSEDLNNSMRGIADKANDYRLRK